MHHSNHHPLPALIEKFLTYANNADLALLNHEYYTPITEWVCGATLEEHVFLWLERDDDSSGYRLQDLLNLEWNKKSHSWLIRDDNTQDEITFYNLVPQTLSDDLLEEIPKYKTKRLLGAYQSWREFEIT